MSKIQPGKPIYKYANECAYTDTIDLFCAFSNELELSANKSDIAFRQRRLDFLKEEVSELTEATRHRDKIEEVDGAADVAFVAITQIYHVFRDNGFDHTQALARTKSALIEVGKTNIVKCTPEAPFAKIKKPEGWTPPNIEDLFLTTEDLIEKKQLEMTIKESMT